MLKVDKPTVFVHVSGGVVQCVMAEGFAETPRIILIDSDIEGDEDDGGRVTDSDGTHQAHVMEYPTDPLWIKALAFSERNVPLASA